VTQIVLMVPRKPNLTAQAIRSGTLSARFADDPTTVLANLPWIPGECEIEQYRFMILVRSVSWSTEVEADVSADARRTAHAPKVAPVRITRPLDSASAALTKHALMTKVTEGPWELHFLRSLGGGAPGAWQSGYMQICFMTMRLHHALITNYSLSAGADGAEETLEVSPGAVEWIYHKGKDDQTIEGQRVVRYNVQTGSLG
jgi:type VI protein secretion system component Hcp